MPQTPDNVPPIPDYSRLLDGRVAAVTGGGRDGIVAVHAVGALRGHAGGPVSGAVKAAVAKSTSGAAARCGRRRIRVNAIGPALTQPPHVDYLRRYEDRDDLWTSWAPVAGVG